MASLKIEGGRALSGRIAVEGNKNSALPLIAACLLTDQPCELTNVPRIRDVDVLLELIEALGATVEGRGHRHAADPVRAASRAIARIPALVGTAARIGAAARAAARAASDRRGSRRPAATFPTRRTISTHLAGARSRSAPCRSTSPGTRCDAPERSDGRVVLSRRGVGHRDRNGAPRRGRGATGRSEIRHAAMEPHVVELCEFLRRWASRSKARARSTIRVEAPARFDGRDASSGRRLHRSRQLGRHRRDHRTATSR